MQFTFGTFYQNYQHYKIIRMLQTLRHGMYFYLAWRNFFEAINFFYNARITKTWLFEAYHNPFLGEI